MPVRPGAIDNPAPIAVLLAPARPLPAAPEKPTSSRPQTGEASAPKTQALVHLATVRIRGPIGSVATVGPNAATIGAPGITGLAHRHSQQVQADAFQAIGRNLDAKV